MVYAKGFLILFAKFPFYHEVHFVIPGTVFDVSKCVSKKESQLVRRIDLIDQLLISANEFCNEERKHNAHISRNSSAP